MGQYGFDNYGDSVYGGDVNSQARSVRSLVGAGWDVALANVGLKLAPGNKAYDKHAAQTFSFNPKSLFKQGDGAALNARDLYFWNRLEHSRWDGGETYEPWAPDPNQVNHNSTKYADSQGFDVSDPHKLTHLREVFTSPSFPFVIGVDTPIAYWKLGDPTGAAQAKDEEANASPATVSVSRIWNKWRWWLRGLGEIPVSGSGWQFGVFPGPIANDITTCAQLDGSTASALTAAKLPFASGLAPISAFSLEAWINPSVLPQTNAVFAEIGNETPQGTSYAAAVSADSPLAWWRLNETVGATTAADETGGGRTLSRTAVDSTPVFGVVGAITADATNLALNLTNGVGATSGNLALGAQLSNHSTSMTLECWVKPKTFPTGFAATFFALEAANGSDGFGLTFVQAGGGNTGGSNLGIHIAGANWYDSGYTFPTLNLWYHVVAVLNGAGTTWTFYVNGVQVGTVVHGATGGTDFFIGHPTTSNNTLLDFNVDEVAFYHSALTLAQIQAHYGASGGNIGGWGLAIGAAGGGSGSKLLARLPGALTLWIDSGYTFPTENTWYHVVMTRDASTIKFYVNAVQTPSTSAVVPLAGGYAYGNLGGVVTPNLHFAGLMGQVATYASALSSARITAHYTQGTQGAGSAVLTAGQSYARFIELYSGDLYINQQNTKVAYTTDGGSSWLTVTVPGGDVTTIAAMWSKGDKIYVATATNVYTGDKTSLATFNGGNPALAGVTAGIYYSGQIYVGIGTSLYYVDPATGIKTQLYDTKNFTINFIEAFAGKVWFGGVSGRQTKVWTWTNNTLPPSAANGVGAQVQEGTIPYGFVARCSLVYLNMLLIGGTTAGDTTSEGQGTVYYVTPSGQFGQLCILGPLMNDIKGTGYDYGVRSMWGADNQLWMGASHSVGIARYDFAKGAFSKHVQTTSYTSPPSPSNLVLAVAYFGGKAIFAVKADGNIWREGVNKTPIAWIETSEFQELPFVPKLIDGIEGAHAPLNDGESIEIQMSFDKGLSWKSMGITQDAGLVDFNLQLANVLANHWRTRIYSSRGSDPVKAPELYTVAPRFTPKQGDKHEWILETVLPTISTNRMGGIQADAGARLLAKLWAAYEDGVCVDFIDRDRVHYKVLVTEMKNEQPTQKQARESAQQLRLDTLLTVELLEVQRLG